MTETAERIPVAQADSESQHRPYVPDGADVPEFTWSAVALGAVLGIVFGASSLYLVLKVGLTVSASIPVAVLSITLFRIFSKIFGLRRATILENNIVQTTGSAGESIAFGAGVTIPALLLLGFEMDVVRVMVVGVLGGLLGILMMIPLRRAFIVKQHHKLPYPEGTACADVLVVGEQGGATAKTVFAGFGLAFLYKFAMQALHLWKEDVSKPLVNANGKGLNGAVFGSEVSPELLGVGYIIGPRIASVMLGGGVLAYLVIAPLIVYFTSNQTAPLAPATAMVKDFSASDMRNQYILYIGAGAVAAGGVISMVQALPLIGGSIVSGLRDLRDAPAGQETASARRRRRTERDLPLSVVFLGSIGLIAALAAAPGLGLGFNFEGFVGAGMIVFFGFLFVTVSSRLTGEIGSSSNPISGMTVATLLFTCLIFLAMGKTGKPATLTALTIAAVVCIAASNGGTTAQDLKTGYLVGATPRSQQYAILIGALTSALVMGVTLLLLNKAGTIYTKDAKYLPEYHVANVAALTQHEKAGGQYAGQDPIDYHVLQVAEGEIKGVAQGKYLVDDSGTIRYLVDPAINGRVAKRDDGKEVPNKFEAPKTRLMALIIDGTLNQKLPWRLVMIGVLIAVTLELAGVPSLPFAVGVYLPIQTSVPIFIGGMLRYIVDKVTRRTATDADTSPGTLLATGYIAGGTIAGVIVAFMTFLPDRWTGAIDMSGVMKAPWAQGDNLTLIAFGGITLVLLLVGFAKPFKAKPPEGPPNVEVLPNP